MANFHLGCCAKNPSFLQGTLGSNRAYYRVLVKSYLKQRWPFQAPVELFEGYVQLPRILFFRGIKSGKNWSINQSTCALKNVFGHLLIESIYVHALVHAVTINPLMYNMGF